MSKEDKYFQFPIAALTFNKSIDKVSHEEMQSRLQELLSYCMIDVGTSIVEKHPEAAPIIASRRAAQLNIRKEEFTRNELVVLCGAEQLGLLPSNIDWKSRKDVYDRYRQLSYQHGSQLCRVRSDILWSYHNEPDKTWREFATLCAVFAGIGSWAKQRLSYERIGSMAMGFNGQRQRDENGAKKRQLSDRQTAYTVKALEAKGFFVSASPNYRHVFYSHRMSLTQLLDELVASAPAKPTATEKTKLIQERLQKQAKARKHGGPI